MLSSFLFVSVVFLLLECLRFLVLAVCFLPLTVLLLLEYCVFLNRTRFTESVIECLLEAGKPEMQQLAERRGIAWKVYSLLV